jgi:hypothetical protein
MLELHLQHLIQPLPPWHRVEAQRLLIYWACTMEKGRAETEPGLSDSWPLVREKWWHLMLEQEDQG